MWRWLRTLLAMPHAIDHSLVIKRFEDGTPRPHVTEGPTMLQLVKGLKPGAQRVIKAESERT